MISGNRENGNQCRKEMTKTPTTSHEDETTVLTCKRKPLEQVTIYEYLRVMFSIDGKIRKYQIKRSTLLTKGQ